MLGRSSFHSNIVRFLSYDGGKDNFFFVKLGLEFESKQASLARLQEPPRIDTVEAMFGETVANAMLDEIADSEPTNACNLEQVRKDREAADTIKLLQLKLHYQRIFYNELLDVLMNGAK